MSLFHPDTLKLERPKPDGLWKFHKDIRRVIRTGAGFRMAPKTAAKKAAPLLPYIKNEELR